MGGLPYSILYSDDEVIRAFLAEISGHQGKVGNAKSYLLNAKPLTAFAVKWLEDRFGQD